MNSYDIVADAVRKYWNEVSQHPCDVIAFFYQRYDFENAYNDMLVKGDIESFEKAHETLENMIPKPKFDIHLDD